MFGGSLIFSRKKIHNPRESRVKFIGIPGGTPKFEENGVQFFLEKPIDFQKKNLLSKHITQFRP